MSHTPHARRRALLTVVLSLLALAVLAPVASAKRVVETVFQGHLSASLSYDPQKGNPSATGLHIRIRRSGKVVVDRDIPYGTVPARDLPKKKSLALKNVDGDSRPEILLDTFTGGAHCCFKTDVYDYVSAKKYRRVVINWRDAGYNLRDLDGVKPLEFVSADARFAYEFVPYAFSGFPTRIFHFTGGHFKSVTKSFPATVKRNAKFWYDKADSAGAKEPVRGYLAAYAADKALLGQGDAGLAKIRSLKRGGKAFGDKVEQFLINLNYLEDPEGSG
jgi:hypothetical protein